MILDMLKNKILFLFKRCDHNNNKISILKDLSFLPITSSVIITWPFKSTVENDSNENNFDMNYSKDVSNKKESTSRKRSISTLKTLKKNKIQKLNLIEIAEINASAYYHLIKNKENKLFSLIMNKIYDISIQSLFEILSQTKRDNHISINKSYSCGSTIKYKRCYKSYTSKSIQINNANVLTSQKMLNKFFINYHNYANVFDKSQTNILSSYRFYNHKLKFAKGTNKNILFKSRIYLISNHKLEQIKKYLNEHLKKRFIIFNHALFASPVLFVKKPNDELRFCVNYRKLNVIIKRNRYFISLIDEILIKIQGCKYLTRLNIIIVFNKLRMHSNNENFITFVTFLKAYKYRVLSFELTNDSVIYQQYMNDILFEYLNDFY